MIKFRKGDKIVAPSGDEGLVLKRRGKYTLVFWKTNLHYKFDLHHPFEIDPNWYGWEAAHVWNETESLHLCDKIGTFDQKIYETYRILYGKNNQ